MMKAKEYDWKDSNLELIGSEEDRQVKKASAQEETAWKPVLSCTEPNLFVWRINKFKVEPVQPVDIGTFYNGDSYIVLSVTKKDDKLLYDVHFWIGEQSTQDEYGTAAYKTVELDTLLDDMPVQYREVQGQESELFKSYFTTFRTLEGGYATGFRHVKPEEYQPRLLHFCLVKKKVEVQEVTLSRQSLTSDDVFILDQGKTLIQWNGKSCDKNEKLAAARFCQMMESERNGRCKADVTDEIDAEDDEIFKNLLPDVEVTKKAFHGGSYQKEMYSLKCLSDADGKLTFEKISDGSCPRSMVTENDVFILTNGDRIFVYIGDGCSEVEKANAMIHASNFAKQFPNPLMPITVVKPTRVVAEYEALLDD